MGVYPETSSTRRLGKLCDELRSADPSFWFSRAYGFVHESIRLDMRKQTIHNAQNMDTCDLCYLLPSDLWIWEQICNWNLAKSRQHRTKDAPGGGKTGPRGYVPKKIKKKKRYWMKVQCKWLQNESQYLKVWFILGNSCRCLFASFFDVKKSSKILGSF